MSKFHNKKNKQQLFKDLMNERFSRRTVSFYRYMALENINELRDDLYREWSALGILGRVYVANEGVNAQVSVPEPNWGKFKTTLSSREVFKNIPFKFAVKEGVSFIKLSIKIKKEIVAYNVPSNEYDMSKVGQHLNYQEYNTAIDNGAIVLDMRNRYEAEVGRFENAIVPDVDRSQELLVEAKRLLKGHEDDKILIYCTGGIRCEKASAYLKHHGFNDVNQLDGGIINYAHNVEKNNVESKFYGKNFVFDRRMGERVTSDVLSQCHQCGKSADTHVNCANEACHILFIQCLVCARKYMLCCSSKCAEFLQKPQDERKKLFKDKQVAFTAQLSDRIKPRLDEVYQRGS